MKRRKASAVARKNSYTGDSGGKSMGLKGSTNGSKKFSFGSIGRILYPLTEPQTDRKILSSAVTAAVAEMKK